VFFAYQPGLIFFLDSERCSLAKSRRRQLDGAVSIAVLPSTFLQTSERIGSRFAKRLP
jgi:hypothetical protein